MKLDSYSSCQLTAVPSDKLDLSMDFHSDVDYDYYEKNANASPSCRYLEFTSEYGQRRQWGVAGGVGGGGGQDLSLWHDVNSLWNRPNEVAGARGDDRPASASFGLFDDLPGDDRSLSSLRHHHRHHGKGTFFHKGVGPSFTPTFLNGGGRRPVSPNGERGCFCSFFSRPPHGFDRRPGTW